MLSIIIPAFNEEKNIGKCLESLVNQKIDEPFEVIAVDNASTDATSNIIHEYASKFPKIKLVVEPAKGRGAARSAGCEVAKGEIFLSTDADTICPPNWAATLIAPIRAGTALATTGVCRIEDNGWLKNAIFNFCQPIVTKLYRFFSGHYWLAGFSSAVTREVYFKAGKYSRKLNAVEDVDLSIKVSKICGIKLVDNASVIFSGRRFKKNWLFGTLDYVWPTICYYLKRERVFLKDVR